MEIEFRNTRDDFKAYYKVVFADRITAYRANFYYALVWYLTVFGLGIYIATKHDEIFATCIFLALGFAYVRQNWSFDRHVETRAKEYADAAPETACQMRLDDQGISERNPGVELKVAWTEIHGYTVADERLFIRFLKNRGIVVPMCYLSPDQREELIRILEAHQVQRRS